MKARRAAPSIAPIPLTARDVMVGRVAAHAAAFEGRWRMSSLARIDSRLAARFTAQLALWHAALGDLDDDTMGHQGEAMIRGWDAITAAMEGVFVAADDTYLIGHDAASGTRVVISDRVAACAARAPADVFVTPDDVARLVASLGPLALAVMLEWPGAEIVDIREKADEREAT